MPVTGADPLENLNQIKRPPVSFNFTEVTFNEVREIINSLKNKGGRDIFGLNVKWIKPVKNILIVSLTKLINFCFKENIFPSVLKKSYYYPDLQKRSRRDSVKL